LPGLAHQRGDETRRRSRQCRYDFDEELHPEYIVPSVFDKRVAEAVLATLKQLLMQLAVARRERAGEISRPDPNQGGSTNLPQRRL